MGMDTSCGNKISLSKLFLFFFFQAFINVLDFLQHQFLEEEFRKPRLFS